MARAAVKAKQQAQAKAQPAKQAHRRGKRGNSGDPNQQLFFMRLRRRQKWVYLGLAIVFAATFAGVGVGSGSGGMSQLYSGLFGSGGNPVAKAQAEIKKDPKSAKGYRDLALAYEAKGDTGNAISALGSYLKLQKKDAAAWTELGGLQMTQAQAFATAYRQAQSAAQASNPGQAFQLSGTLSQALGSNPLAQPSAQASNQVVQLYQQAIGAYNTALSSYQTAAKIQPKNAQAQFQIATAAVTAGQYQVSINAWKRFLKLDPTSTQKKQVENEIKQLEKALNPSTPATKKKKKK